MEELQDLKGLGLQWHKLHDILDVEFARKRLDKDGGEVSVGDLGLGNESLRAKHRYTQTHIGRACLIK